MRNNMIPRRILANDINWEIQIRIIFGIVLLAFMILLLDLLFDFVGWDNPLHYFIEGLPLLSLTVLLLYLLGLLRKVRTEAVDWQKRAGHAELDVGKWKHELEVVLKGLADVIDLQMRNWKLTNAEKEIGILILKGMSFKEIAEIRSTSERTVRQQTLEIYKKSGVDGRAQFSAFFLEDLLLPLEPKPN